MTVDDDLVSIKSKIGVEFRRFSVSRKSIARFQDFFHKIERMHHLRGTPFAIHYYDQDDELLPINSDGKLAKAIDTATHLKLTHNLPINNNDGEPNASYLTYHLYQQRFNYPQRQVVTRRPYLRLFLEKCGIPNSLYYLPSFTWKNKRKDNLINLFMPSSVSSSSSSSRPRISMPEDFRQVSSIIAATPSRRRVVLNRGCSEKPLGFYIRDGAYLRMNADRKIENHYGIFISRVVPGGLADSTNLLAENDEILEVNGIEVGKGKRLDQVRDMMIANSSNLIITTRPARPFN